MTVFEADKSDIKEVAPGNVFIIKSDGTSYEQPYKPAGKRESCTFERIYFSRGNDRRYTPSARPSGGCSARSSMKASAGTSKTACSATFPIRRR